MAYPKASILWVNYNSMKIIDIVVESLQSALELDYPSYELIIVDNGSTDGSYDVIKRIVEPKRTGNPRVRLIKLERNRGFNTANNIAFRARDRDAKYVVILNNDAAPASDSLLNMVEAMESEEGLAASQGIITTWDARRVDNMGFIVDELLFSHALYRGADPRSIRRPHYCTFVSGAYSIYLVDAVLKVNGAEELFEGQMFAYYDDKVLGLKLWYKGFRVKAFPFIAARHYGSASFGRLTTGKLYLTTRNFMVLLSVAKNLRYKPIISVGYPLRRLAEIIVRSRSTDELNERLYALARALLRARNYASTIEYTIDARGAPLKKLSLLDALKTMLSELEG